METTSTEDRVRRLLREHSPQSGGVQGCRAIPRGGVLEHRVSKAIRFFKTSLDVKRNFNLEVYHLTGISKHNGSELVPQTAERQ